MSLYYYFTIQKKSQIHQVLAPVIIKIIQTINSKFDSFTGAHFHIFSHSKILNWHNALGWLICVFNKTPSTTARKPKIFHHGYPEARKQTIHWYFWNLKSTIDRINTYSRVSTGNLVKNMRNMGIFLSRIWEVYGISQQKYGRNMGKIRVHQTKATTEDKPESKFMHLRPTLKIVHFLSPASQKKSHWGSQ